jgi:DNA topoisomerase-1
MAATSKRTPETGSRRPRLRRSDCSDEGLTRVARGRGFSSAPTRGWRARDPDARLRLKELAIPPAWSDV